MLWTPVQHPIYSVRGRTRMAKWIWASPFDTFSGNPECSFPLIAPAVSPTTHFESLFELVEVIVSA